MFHLIIVLCFIAERSSAFGRLGISYGIGMVVGPLIGGFVTDHFDEQTAAGTAMLGSVISVIIVILFIPHNTKKKGKINYFNNNCVISFYTRFLFLFSGLAVSKMICVSATQQNLYFARHTGSIRTIEL